MSSAGASSAVFINCPDESDLLSKAAVTDEPRPEIAEVGHDRCIVPVSDANLDTWLNPAGCYFEELHTILEARERPYLLALTEN